MELLCDLNGFHCHVNSPEITEPTLIVNSISGINETGKNAKIALIRFYWTTHFIPRGLDVFFPNITKIFIENRGLQSICRDDLSQFKNLEELYLGYNQLTALPNDLFEDTPNLNRISFAGNKIEFASSNLFKPIINNDFRLISFIKNSKINTCYAPGVSGSASSVHELMKIIDFSCTNPIALDPLPSFEVVKDEILTLDHMEKSAENFENLLISGKFSDFVIIVNKSKRFNVHKQILVAQSEGFAEMFEKNPKAVEMTIEDLSPETVEEFLYYLYSGKLKKFEDKSLELFALASKIKVGNLKESMEEFTVNQLHQSNAFKAFSIAHSYGSDKLKRAAFEQIKKMFPDKTLPESWMDDLPKVKEIVIAKELLDETFKKLKNM